MKIAAALLAISGPAAAAPIPDPIAAMLDMAADDADQLKIIADVAKKTNPAAADAIDTRVAALTKARAEARQERLASQGVLEGWSGSGEVGANISSGNTNNKGVAIGIDFAKDTRSWRHVVHGFVDYQRQDGVTTRERYLAGYEGNFNITPRFYALGTLSFERDAFSGFRRRFADRSGSVIASSPPNE